MPKKIDLTQRHKSYLLDNETGYYVLSITKKGGGDVMDLPREFKIVNSKFKNQKNEELAILYGKEKSPWGNPYFRKAVQEITRGLLVYVSKRESSATQYNCYGGLLLAISDNKAKLWVYNLGESDFRSYGEAVQEFTARVKNRYSRV